MVDRDTQGQHANDPDQHGLITRRKALKRGVTALSGMTVGATIASTRDFSLDPTHQQHAIDGAAIIKMANSQATGELSDETITKAKNVGFNARKSVVNIDPEAPTSGTGWMLNDGQIVTNSHVVENKKSVTIETFDERTATATRVGYHEDLIPDVALLETDLSDIPTLSTGDSDALQTDQPVVQVGHPAGVGTWVISLGRYKRYQSSTNWLLSKIPTASGNSGSPLLTLEGKVVGVTSGSTSTDTGSQVSRPDKVYTSFPSGERATSVPIETLLKWVNKWTDSGTPTSRSTQSTTPTTPTSTPTETSTSTSTPTPTPTSTEAAANETGGGNQSIEQAIAGDDNTIEIPDIQQAIRYWANDEPVPDTGGQKIGIVKVQELIRQWASGG